MSAITSPADIERLVWRLSGWRVEQRSVDVLLGAVQEYAGACVDAGAVAMWTSVGPIPAPPVESLGAGEATQRPVETSAAPSVAIEPSGPVIGAQTVVQGDGIEGAYVLTVTRVEKPVPVRKPERGVPKADLTEPTRTCRKCGQTYAIQKFNRDPYSRGGRKTACGPCENTRRREARRVKRAAEREAREARRAAREVA